MSNIDFLIIGSGLYGATMARILTDAGYTCLILEKRNHIAGNIYSERTNDGYDKHVYGPHIFHTDKPDVEEFVKKYATWETFKLNILANNNGNIYHLPFNMNTFYDVFKEKSPEKVKEIIGQEIKEANIKKPSNLEEQAISMVGTTIYNTLIKNYTEKQWGKPCNELSQDIITRLPLRFSYNNDYYNDYFQAIPKDGYTKFVKNIIGNIPCLCNSEFKKENYEYWQDNINCLIIYCGAIDELLEYELGELEWRSLYFDDEEYKYNWSNGQGCPILNDVGNINKFTRSIEHMWFSPSKVQEGISSIITKEYPDNWKPGKERYYAVNNKDTDKKYKAYINLLLKRMPKIKLGGRLGKYKYFDMDDTIYEAMTDAKRYASMFAFSKQRLN